MTENNKLVCKKAVYIIRDREDNKILTSGDSMLLCFPDQESAEKKISRIKTKMKLRIDIAVITFKTRDIKIETDQKQ